MEAIPRIPLVTVFDVSGRGRIAPQSGWHAAERRVNLLALRVDREENAPPRQPAWPGLLRALGGSVDLANRKSSDLQPALQAVNRIIEALNTLPADADYGDLERALGLREPPESHDRIGDAMNRVMLALRMRREDDYGADPR